MVASPFPHLFAPLKLGDLDLAHRIVLAPMTRNRAGTGEVPTELMALYYAQRTDGNLLISEGSQICPMGQGYPGTPGIYTEAQIAGWKNVTDAVHAKGGKIFLQLWHVGRASHPSLLPDQALPVAPSAIRPAGKTFTAKGLEDFVTPRALETNEIPSIIEAYGQGAANAKKAGFDGVEIHAANGYLLDQFLRDKTNKREDVYGGSQENRLRLLREVTQNVCKIWDPSRVGVRLSPVNPFNDIEDSAPQKTFGAAIDMLNAFGLGYLHMVEGSLAPEGSAAQVDFSALRKQWKGLYMANGGYDGPRAESALASGYADLVSFGSSYLANPDLPERLRRNAPLNAPDRTTFYGGDAHGYTDYPVLAPKA